MKEEPQVTCDICNFAVPYGVMGFDGYSERCNCDMSEYFGKEIGYFDCSGCWFGKTNLPIEEY